MPPTKIWLSWSSGKDSAWALHELRASPEFEVVALLTTINRDAGRVAMHAVRETLLDAQAAAAGRPLIKVPIPAHCSNADYEGAMGAAMARARDEGIRHVAFGDLFLEDIRKYREEKLRAVGMTPQFPIWGRETAALAREMVARGLRAHLTCVDPKRLDRRFAGRLFDADLLDELPPGVDACGENGEFHSFAFGGPMFLQPVRVALGEIVERDAFVFADLLNADAP
ncbi:MAG TPA: hypothetical protein VGG55_02565 [Candidatus Acidoferrales bacterium]|jgi:uncharacterized protein (TIGR00290 family)